jgi:hypothetical protein
MSARQIKATTTGAMWAQALDVACDWYNDAPTPAQVADVLIIDHPHLERHRAFLVDVAGAALVERGKLIAFLREGAKDILRIDPNLPVSLIQRVFSGWRGERDRIREILAFNGVHDGQRIDPAARHDGDRAVPAAARAQ